MAHNSMSKSLVTGLIGGILGAVGTAAVFALKDEQTRTQLSDRLSTMTQKGKDLAKKYGSEITSLMKSKEGEDGEKAKRIQRRAALA